MVQKGHLLLFVSKKRKRMHQKDDAIYRRKMHQNNDADHDEIPFSFKERVYQEEIDIKMHQNSDAILVD